MSALNVQPPGNLWQRIRRTVHLARTRREALWRERMGKHGRRTTARERRSRARLGRRNVRLIIRGAR